MVKFFNKKSQPKFNQTSRAEAVLDALKVEYEVRADGTIFVPGDIPLHRKRLKRLPDLSQVEVGGGFYCQVNKLTSLVGAPKHVAGTFDCESNRLVTLEGAPEAVGGHFYCRENMLTSLKGAPKHIGKNFWCDGNLFEDLTHAPETVGGDFRCSNGKLTSLKGAPREVGGGFWCGENPNLVTLAGGPEKVGEKFSCVSCGLTSLEGAPEIVGSSFYCYGNRLVNFVGMPRSFGSFTSEFGCFSSPQNFREHLESSSFDDIAVERPVHVRQPIRLRGAAHLFMAYHS